MGAVYLAEHPDIGRKVAVKVLRSEFSRDVQLLGRFLNEARAANAIRHPNIIEILDSGTTDNGMPYLVMELLEGEVLAGRMRRLGACPCRWPWSSPTRPPRRWGRPTARPSFTAI
jgi:eukaryotic-like serine/threonine-protein kinase